MCGIVGYTGTQQAAPVLLDGLGRLEYRGYDSAGLAVRNGSDLAEVVKSTGKLRSLIGMLNGDAADEPAGGPVDASAEAIDARAELYKRLGISMPAPAAHPGSDEELVAALQKQSDADRLALEEAYALRAAERGI